jgi:hypothetical protein
MAKHSCHYCAGTGYRQDCFSVTHHDVDDVKASDIVRCDEGWMPCKHHECYWTSFTDEWILSTLTEEERSQ